MGDLQMRELIRRVLVLQTLAKGGRLEQVEHGQPLRELYIARERRLLPARPQPGEVVDERRLIEAGRIVSALSESAAIRTH